MRDIISRGLEAPLLAIGGGALGFWSALRELESFKDTKHQRCWVHKIANVLNNLPKRVQSETKLILLEMMNAPDKKSAEIERKKFESIFKNKYKKSVKCLNKGRDKLITFFDFPGLHLTSLRTTNLIESSFATVKLRTKTTRGAGRSKSEVNLAFKLLMECKKKWRKIKGWSHIENIILGVEYKDGVVVPS